MKPTDRTDGGLIQHRSLARTLILLCLLATGLLLSPVIIARGASIIGQTPADMPAQTAGPGTSTGPPELLGSGPVPNLVPPSIGGCRAADRLAQTGPQRASANNPGPGRCEGGEPEVGLSQDAPAATLLSFVAHDAVDEFRRSAYLALLLASFGLWLLDRRKPRIRE